MIKGIFARKVFERSIGKYDGEYHVGDLRKYVSAQWWDYLDFREQDHPFTRLIMDKLKNDEKLCKDLIIPIYQSKFSFDIDGEPYYVIFDRNEDCPKRIIYVATEYTSCALPVSDEKAIHDFTTELDKFKKMEENLRKNVSEQEDIVRICLERMNDEGRMPRDESVGKFIEEYGAYKEKRTESIECNIEIHNLERRIKYHQKCVARGDRSKILIPQTGTGMIGI